MPTTWNKPAGVPVFAPHDDPRGACCLHALMAAQPERAEVPWPEGFEGGIAHRLDVPTSGALLIADDLQELTLLRRLFRERALRKTYRFEAARQVAWRSHRISTPIAHDRRRRSRMVIQRGASTPHRGRWYPAFTELRHLRDDLWEAVITTGVTHQIRVHAASVGLALRGDRLYGGGHTPEGWSSDFRLHHVGLEGPGALRTDPVSTPAWAEFQS